MCEIAKKIKARRIELNLTLEDVGQAVGVGRSTVQRWESGMIKNMGRDKIAALAHVLQMDPVELVPSDFYSLNLQLFSKEKHEYKKEDQELLEALHQNPKLRLLFDKQKVLTDSDLDAVLGIVNAIQKERDGDV